jgi:hypothetical protein
MTGSTFGNGMDGRDIVRIGDSSRNETMRKEFGMEITKLTRKDGSDGYLSKPRSHCIVLDLSIFRSANPPFEKKSRVIRESCIHELSLWIIPHIRHISSLARNLFQTLVDNYTILQW